MQGVKKLRQLVRASNGHGRDYQKVKVGKKMVFDLLREMGDEAGPEVFNEAVATMAAWNAHLLVKDLVDQMANRRIEASHRTYASILKCYLSKYKTDPEFFDDAWAALPPESLRDPSLWSYKIRASGPSAVEQMTAENIKPTPECYAAELSWLEGEAAEEFYKKIPEGARGVAVEYEMLKKAAREGRDEVINDKKGVLAGSILKWYKLRFLALSVRGDWSTAMSLARELEEKGVPLDSEAYILLFENARRNAALSKPDGPSTWIQNAEALVAHSEANGCLIPSLYYRLLTLYQDHGYRESHEKLLVKMNEFGLRVNRLRPMPTFHKVSFA
eukprot:TRINITY_DN29735_c0_g1_i1.p1 TRINITY_DN29735_c0_g1~~TRINITY_DN29735_c0_g1_i1.p1  ORF type:complete len:379 (+),score=48.37 TRINITY_DN29735_c0_g1_i1:149-1138(+)